MSTQSETVFEWSVKLLCNAGIRVGIASQLRPNRTEIFSYDENAILYNSYKGLGIRVGPNIIHSLPVEHTVGGVARFRFQPRTKKILFIR